MWPTIPMPIAPPSCCAVLRTPDAARADAAGMRTAPRSRAGGTSPPRSCRLLTRSTRSSCCSAGSSRAGDLLLDPVRRHVGDRLMSAKRRILRIERAALDDGPLIGAATLVLRDLFLAPLGVTGATPGPSRPTEARAFEPRVAWMPRRRGPAGRRQLRQRAAALGGRGCRRVALSACGSSAD